ncbi:DUF1980 domain-containing protein [Solidesulfovibrio sp.]|uniref:TIGR03943 family putative permease subunit n=1 Tax=Solidesulfovibrio sp. TaxID=2910990 RepID=UPI002633B993|nr:DUF1980 domain-containing protein [Solidesulfovibrio sp.]
MKKFPAQALAARIDGAAWLLMAGFMAWLPLAGDYWMFLNPKFKPVTLAAAAVLAVLAAYALWRPVSRPSLGRTAAYVALLAMAALTQGGTQAISGRIDSDPFATAPSLPAPPPESTPSRMIALGKEFIPINTGELFDIAAKGRSEAWDRPYVMRGFAKRDPALDASGEFVLFRLAVWCCFADSTGVGFKVKIPPGTELPADKSWIVAYGRLTDMPADQRGEYMLPGMSFSSIAPGALFAADHLETAPLPTEQVYMFEWRAAEPYAY